MREVTLPSGNIIKIDTPPFEVSKALYQATMEEVRTLKLGDKDEVMDFIKNLVCTAISSKKIETCLQPCLERTLYNGSRITKDTWEPIAARADYYDVCKEVIQENLAPFTKTLTQQFSPALAILKSSLV